MVFVCYVRVFCALCSLRHPKRLPLLAQVMLVLFSYIFLFSYIDLGILSQSLVAAVSLRYQDPYWCCGKSFGSMGGLGSHRRHRHNILPAIVEGIKRRRTYTLGFKAKCCATVEEELSVKCLECGEIVQYWKSRYYEGVDITREHEWRVWDAEEQIESDPEDDNGGDIDIAPVETPVPEILKCKACYSTQLASTSNTQSEVAEQLGIAKGTLSKWMKFRQLWFQLCKNDKKLKSLVNNMHTCTHDTCTHAHIHMHT